MQDLQDISNAISELQSEAITDIGVLASKKEPPAGYNVVSVQLPNTVYKYICNLALIKYKWEWNRQLINWNYEKDKCFI